MPVRHLGDGGDVLHLEGLGTRRLREHRSCVWTDQSFDPGADLRVVVGGFHTKILEHPVTELPGRQVDRIRHQKMVARLETGQESHRYGSQA
jgi:hypothetical protein